MKKMNFLEWLAFVLVVVGGLNWGLIGLFNFNLVAAVFGQMTFISRLIYALVGISSVYVALLPAIESEGSIMSNSAARSS
jgi:uncharacterized protein